MAAACLSPAVAAQDVPGAVVQGRVSGASGVALASVRIVRGGLRPDTIYTDDAGRYRLASLGAGMHLVSFQHIGYLPVEMIVQVTTDTTLAVDVQMERRTVVLDTMSVRAEGANPYERKLRTVGFEERRAQAERSAVDATFITPDEIRRRNPLRLSQLLEGRRSVHIQYTPGGIGAIAVGRDGRCVMTVWLDGQRVFPTGSQSGAAMGSGLGVTGGGGGGSLTLAPRIGASDVTGLNMIGINEVAAVEIYPSPSGTPPQFQALTGTCGAIVVWSKQ